ncbi:hypothetical protein EPK99_08790 [Neorhizobium lilium]|uniref:Uncharacterized protein n=1 Tax=Neorhizobium lilium TaxID=2503024 RepID=A0A3S3TZU8_9HYPH|nr:hypothetical protein [Neorhizobium lilium]RWX78681.1 hypothetical protein EPK99_08790 [Neorhizobium lilium]
MAEPGFNQKLAEIGRHLTAMRASVEASRSVLSQAVQQRRLPEDEVLAAEEQRQRDDAGRWRNTEGALAAEVAMLGEAAARHKLAFDRRDQPTGMERLLGRFSRAAMRKRTVRRWLRLDSFDRLGAMMRQADALYGLLSAERQHLLEERHGCESDLVQLAQQRADMLQQLEMEPGAAARAEAVGLVEDTLRLFGTLATALNDRVASCNVLLHKLAVETEEILILYRVLADLGAQGPAAEADLARLPHLREAHERFRSGRLIGLDLDRLREKADAGFFLKFPAHAPARSGSETASGSPVSSGNSG